MNRSASFDPTNAINNAGGAPSANQGVSASTTDCHNTDQPQTNIPHTNITSFPEDCFMILDDSAKNLKPTVSKKRRRSEKHISFFCNHQNNPVSQVFGFTPFDREEFVSAPWWTAQDLAQTRKECERIVMRQLGPAREEYETYFEILSNSFKPCMLPEHVEYSLHQVISHYPLQARGLERHIIHSTQNLKKTPSPPHVPTVLEFQSKLSQVPEATLEEPKKSMLLARIATLSSRSSRQLAYKLAQYDAAAAAAL